MNIAKEGDLETYMAQFSAFSRLCAADNAEHLQREVQNGNPQN